MPDLHASVEAAVNRGAISPEAAVQLRRWLSAAPFAEHRDEVARQVAAGDWPALDDAFRTVLPFGTAGRRGPVGVGPNRINARTIAESAAGLATVLATRGAEPVCIVAHDVRGPSAEYARACAEVLLAHRVRPLLFDGPRSTPELAFTVLDRGAAGGIMITASHNPPHDNGFKAFGPHGGQLVPPSDRRTIEAVRALADAALPRVPLAAALADGRAAALGPEADDAYWSYVAGQAICDARAARLVFSALDGIGSQSVLPVLQRAGFVEVHPVATQAQPSPTFEHVTGGSANPENAAALDQVLAHCRAVDADAGLASDPDADRIGYVAREADGGYRVFNGNEIAALIAWHTCERRAAAGTLGADPVILRTIVGTPLIDRIAADYGVRVVGDLPIGYRWMGEWLAGHPHADLVLCADESHGLNRGARVRDKDAASAALALAELTADLKARGLTPGEQLARLHQRHGYHVERVVSRRMPRAEDRDQVLAALRKAPPRELLGVPVRRVVDRRAAPYRSPVSDEPAAENFLLFHLGQTDGDITVAIRPSGTEPKIKVYVLARTDSVDPAARRRLDEWVDALPTELLP